MLPPIDPITGLLPAAADPYPATLEELHALFVVAAPFSAERELLFEALTLYAKLIWAIFPDALLRINGGFVTHKTWAAPADVDIAVVCPTLTPQQVESAITAPLFTILNGQGDVFGGRVGLPKVHVMGGLVDAFPVPGNLQHVRDYFDNHWSSVTDQAKNVIAGLRKGYVEVSNPNVTS